MSLAVAFPTDTLVVKSNKPPLPAPPSDKCTESQFSAWQEARKVRFLDAPEPVSRPSIRRMSLQSSSLTSYPEQFNPNFESKQSVTIHQPLPIVFSKLGTTDGLEQSLRLSSLCSGFEMLQTDSVQCSGPLSKAYLRTAEAISSTSDSDVSSSDILPRQHFTMTETISIVPKVKSVNVQLKGTLTWDPSLKVALFETTSDKGIHVWKLRVFQTASDGQSTKVTETIRGMCPAWQQWIVQKTAGKSHRDLMASYRTLF